jgi:signal transduction histidine kinase
VAHELRSPLTSIKESASLILGGVTGEIAGQQKQMLEIVDRQAKRMEGMISELLDLSRLESGMAKFDKREINFSQIIEDSITEMQPQLHLNQLELVRDIDPALPPVTVDETKMLEVMINLLSNAVKFSNKGGKLCVSAKKTDNAITVSVRDEGHGIEPCDLPHIFEKFCRSRTEDPKYKGTGLGLAICASIIDRHNGTIKAESEGLGKGATFLFTLPLK